MRKWWDEEKREHKGRRKEGRSREGRGREAGKQKGRKQAKDKEDTHVEMYFKLLNVLHALSQGTPAQQSKR